MPQYQQTETVPPYMTYLNTLLESNINTDTCDLSNQGVTDYDLTQIGGYLLKLKQVTNLNLEGNKEITVLP